MSVFLNNLDDFIAPSQACINPLVLNKAKTAAPAPQRPSSSGGGKIVLQTDFSVTEFDGLAKRPLPVPETTAPDLIKTKVGAHNQKVASVSLNDCLACSGCVTSAETVLIQEQSYEKLLERLQRLQAGTSHDDDDDVVVVVCLSPQSVASIAHLLSAHGPTPCDAAAAFLYLAGALKRAGVRYVVDASAGGDVALVEAAEEYLHRHRRGRSTRWTRPPTTVAVSSTALHVVAETAVGLGDGAGSEGGLGAETGLPGATVHVGWPTLDAESIGSSSSGGGGGGSSSSCSSSSSSSGGDGSGGFALPMLASHCPGWVCYAEKTQPQALPYIATGKSGQQVLGAVFKRVFLPGKNVYVVSVQPCFDKKLEASRRDFYDEATGTTDVDLVLSTTELWSLLEHVTTTAGTAAAASASESAGSSDVGSVARALLRPEFADAPGGRDAHEAMCRCCSADGRQAILASDSNAGSGAFLEHVFRAAAERLYGVSLWGQPLVYTAGRNADMAEVDLDCQPAAAAAAAADGAPAASATGRRLKFAKAYGFRNIQGVVLKMKQGRAEYDFVEVMACPR
jgi:hypothetical protein